MFQRRQDGSVDFYRDWNSYKKGFGDLNGEFWLGNDNLHRLTSQGKYKLRIDLEDFDDKKAFASYANFRVASGTGKYRLTAQGYSGNAGTSVMPYQTYTTYSVRRGIPKLQHCKNIQLVLRLFNSCLSYARAQCKCTPYELKYAVFQIPNLFFTGIQ